MQTTFRDNLTTEEKGYALVMPFLRGRYDQVISTGHGPQSAAVQTLFGDFIVEKDGRFLFVEVKVEESSRHGNFFLEVDSNGAADTPGWMRYMRADVLAYLFLDTTDLYLIDFPALRRWADSGKLFKYPRRMQKKTSQKNDTWGHCVPVAELTRVVRSLHFRLGDDGAWQGLSPQSNR